MSDGLSDDECLFDNVWGEGNLGSRKDVKAIFIKFGNRYPKSIKVDYFDNGNIIFTKTIDDISSENLNVISEFRNEFDATKITFLNLWALY